jgi:hypothetical protein
MLTTESVLSYLYNVKKDAGHHINSNWFQRTDCEIEDEQVVWLNDLSLAYCNLWNIPFKFKTIVGYLDISSSRIRSFDFLPKHCNQLNIDDTEFENYDMLIPLFFIETPRIRIAGDDLFGILNEGRIFGKMPRELIPGKINQLRDLDGTL